MKVISPVLLALAACFAARAQTTPEAPKPAQHLIGEIVRIDATGNRIDVKTDAGANAAVVLNEKTLYLKVPPGERDLKKASRISLSDISAGDRIYARGKLSEDGQSLSAASVIVMTKAELTRKHEQDRLEWQRRGIAGKVTAVDAARNEITIQVPNPAGPNSVVVEAGPDVVYRRYSPESVRFSDAKPSSLAEIRTGDHIRALGDRSEDGTHFKAQEIVSGAFRNFPATVTSVNAGSGEIQVKDLLSGKPVTLKITQDSMLRRMPPMMAARLGARLQGGSGLVPRGANGERPSQAPGAGSDASDPGAQPRGGAFGGGQGGGWRTAGGGPPDFQQMLERMPALDLSELKPGDAVIVSGSAGADPSRLNTVAVIAGVEPLLTSPEGERAPAGNWNFEIPLP